MTQYIASRWNLTDLFPGHDCPEMEKALNDLETSIKQFEENRDKLSASISINEFIEMIHLREEIALKMLRISQFSSLLFSEDTQNQIAQNFQTKVQQIKADLQNRTLFFSLWWKDLNEPEADQFFKGAGEFTHWLKQMRKFKPYTLNEAEEKIINIKDVTGVNTIRRLFSTITNRYTFKVEVDDEIKELTYGEAMALAFGPDATIRARAYQEILRVFSNDGAILGQMYTAIVRDFNNENLNLRGYSSPISWRNLSNDIPDEVVDILLDVAQKNTGIYHRYFILKAKWLKMEKLRRYDIYAPITSADKEYEFDYAVKLVLDTFQRFEPKIAELAKRVFDESHIDSEVRKGKQSGAFCSYGKPKSTPYVHQSYNKKAVSIGTLAHELGHAIHGLLAGQHNVFSFSASMPLAETASVFAQMLTMDQLLKEETDEEVRRDILFSQVADSYITIMRQSFFALFEKEAYEKIKLGSSLDDLAEIYMENLRTQFGDSLEVDEQFKWEWVAIPHFYHTPFYVYAYAFGNLLVLALYNQYRREGKTFIPRFIEILAAGGSASPVDILSKAGIDIRTPEFWQGGFDTISEMVDKLEAITME